MNCFRALLVLGAVMFGAAEADAQSYRVGQKVEASLINGGVSFYPATIVAVGQGDHAGEYLVRFEDGREDWRTPAGVQASTATSTPVPAPAAGAGVYRVGQKVEASISAGGITFVPATIAQAGQGTRAGKYLVRFDDGRTDWRDPQDEIKPLVARPEPSGPGTTRPMRATGAMPASLPTGEYQCFYADANAFDSDVPGSYAASYMGSFQILNATTYRYLTGTKLTGRYRYAPATGKITWLSGSLDGRLFQGQFRPARGDDRASIRLRYRDAQGRTGVQHCRKIR